jgi:hypothetical protein
MFDLVFSCSPVCLSCDGFLPQPLQLLFWRQHSRLTRSLGA